MLQKIFFTFLVSIILLKPVFSQKPGQNACLCSIKGKVIDLNTKEPIVGAIIQLQSLKLSTTTDSLGFYTISNICEGTYKLSTNILGYKSETKQVFIEHDHHNEESFLLQESHFHLNEVQIAAQKIISLVQKREIIQNTTIIYNQGLDLSQILQKSLGLQILKTGHQINKPVLHGMHSNRLLVINQGLRQEGQQWGAEHAPEIDIATSQQISVIKGASGLRFGPDAIAGVIVAESLPVADSTHWNGNIGMGYQTNGRVFSTHFSEENKWFWQKLSLGLRLQGNYKNSGNINTPQYSLINTGIKEFNYSLQAFLKYKNIKNEWFWSQFNNKIGLFSGSHIGNITDLQNAILSSKPLDTFTPKQFSRNIERPFQDIQHNLLRTKFTIPIAMGTVTMVSGYQYNFRNEVDILRGNKNLIQNFILNTFSNELVLNHKTKFIGWNGSIGLQQSNQSNLSSGTIQNPVSTTVLIPNYLQNDFGIFVIERLIKTKYEWEAGIRYDYKKQNIFLIPRQQQIIQKLNQNFDNLTYAIGFSFRPNNKYLFQTNLAKAWRAPNINERYSNGVHHGSSAIEEGLPTLKPESNINLTINQSFESEKLKISLDGYLHFFQNYIYLAPTGNTNLTIRGAFPVFKYTQTKATYLGFDTKIKYDLNNFLNFETIFNFLQAQDITFKQPLIGIVPNQWFNSLNFKYLGIETSLNHQFFAKQNRVPSTIVFNQNEPPTFDKNGGDFLPPPPTYHLWNLQIIKTLNLKYQSYKLILDLNNITNKVYRNYMNRLRYFADEQGFNGHFKIQFNF